jgi:hypothetical protein
MAERIRCIPAQHEHAELLAAFFRETWDRTSTAEMVLSSRHRAAGENLAEPGVTPPAWMAVQGDRIIGYCSSLPIRLWNGSEQQPAYWAKGLMVLPEFQNGPIGYKVLKELSGSVSLIAAVVVNPPAKRLFSALGYSDLGAMPNLLKPLNTRRILEKVDPQRLAAAGIPKVVTRTLAIAQTIRLAGVLGSVADLGLGLRSGRPAPNLTAGEEPALQSSEIDALWLRVRSELSAATVRDGAALIARYRHGTDVPYRWVTVRRAGALCGVMLVRPPRAEGDVRLAGVRISSFSDILIAPSDSAAQSALFAAAESAAAALGADAALCSLTHASLLPLVKRRGYFPRAGNVHFFLRSHVGQTEWPANLKDWWLTRGDSEADSTF